MPVIAERLGPDRSVVWLLTNMPRYDDTVKAFGGLRTHLLAVTISLRNGCRYCTLGHATALELIYLRDHGQLFPLDENALAELSGLQPDELRQRLGEALRQAGLEGELAWVDLVLKVAGGAEIQARRPRRRPPRPPGRHVRRTQCLRDRRQRRAGPVARRDQQGHRAEGTLHTAVKQRNTCSP
jgi:hypothetical protein